MAIAFDNSAQSSNLSGSSTSFSYTCTGSNGIILVGVQITDATQQVSSITYNSLSLTKILAKDLPNSARRVELWYRLSPATGSNTLSVTLTGSVTNWFSVGVTSLTGVLQSGIPDASGSNSANSGVIDMTQSVTTILDNCWLIGIASNANNLNPVADSGTTIRQSMYNRTGNGYEGFMLDSNGAKTPTGSYALGVTSDSGASCIIVISIPPLTVQNLTLTADTGSFTLTGYSAGLGRLYTLVAETGSFILTGFDVILNLVGWSNQSKNSTTFSNQSKNSTTFTNQTKH